MNTFKKTDLESLGLSSEHMKKIKARRQFNLEYCKNKGWNMANITIEQVMEIRKQPE